MGGLIEVKNERNSGGALRVEPVGGGALVSDEHSDPPATARATALPPIRFSFVVVDLNTADTKMREDRWTDSLAVLGLKDRAAEFLAGTMDPADVHRALLALTSRRLELERKGSSFGHLKSLAKSWPKFHHWMEQLSEFSKEEPKLARDHMGALVYKELLSWLGVEAKRFKENDGYLDYGEWNILIADAVSVGFDRVMAQKVVLEACREGTGDAAWLPPPAPDNAAEQAALATERAKEAEAQSRLVEQQRRAAAVEVERAEVVMRASSVELQRRTTELRMREVDAQQEAAQAAKLERERAEREASVREKEAEATRVAAEAQRAAAEADRREAERRMGEEAEVRRADERRVQGAGLRRAVLWFGVASLSGAAIAVAAGFASSDSAIAVGAAREGLALTRSPEAVRDLCAVGNSGLERRERLRKELESTLPSIPFADDRERLSAKALVDCSDPGLPATVTVDGGGSP